MSILDKPEDIGKQTGDEILHIQMMYRMYMEMFSSADAFAKNVIIKTRE